MSIKIFIQFIISIQEFEIHCHWDAHRQMMTIGIYLVLLLFCNYSLFKKYKALPEGLRNGF